MGARVITLYSRQQNMEVSVTSCVRGYHEYQDIWTPFIGETLLRGREEDNSHDRYAVAIYKLATVVGHVPHTISYLCSLFIRRGGRIKCAVIGNRRYSRDLVQGGVEIPCKYTFTHDGQLEEVEKVEKFFGGLNSDDYVCSTVSTSTSSSILTEKRALDVEFIESSDDK